MDTLMLCFVILLYSVCLVKCDISNDNCSTTYTNDDGDIADITKYCQNKTCVAKCCPPDYVIGYRQACVPISKFKKLDPKKLSLTNCYNIANGNRTDTVTSLSGFSLVYNKLFDWKCFVEFESSYYLQKTGSLKRQDDYAQFSVIDALGFCIDVGMNINTMKPEITYREVKSKNPLGEALKSQALFTAIAMLISTFFLFLVWLIYVLNPELAELGHRATRAIFFTLGLGYLLKAITILFVKYFDEIVCKIISPPMYFAFLSSFFWTNLLSLNIYRRFSCPYLVNRNKSKDNARFRWYCVYAYGVPVLIATAATLLDNLSLHVKIMKPAFNVCFGNKEATAYYLQMPVVALTSVNLLLYVMTTYVIYMGKQGGKILKENSTKRNQNAFFQYMRISLLMGVSWMLELVEYLAPNTPTWVFIVVNGWNALIGVAIFFVFVFKKSILIALCKRFGIKAKFVENLQSSHRTTYSWSTNSKQSKRSHNDSQRERTGAVDANQK